MSNASFAELFCKSFECSPENFDEKVFWLCLYPHATLLARLLWRLKRDYFKPDLELIGHIKQLTSSDEVMLEIERFHYRRFRSGFGRGFLKVRISGRRLLDVAGRMFAGAG